MADGVSSTGRLYNKYFYPGGQEETGRNQQGKRKKGGGKQAWQGLDRGKGCVPLIEILSNPCQACFPGAAPMIAPAVRRTPAGQASGWTTGHLLPLTNYWGIFADAPGGGLATNGSRVLQRPLSLCRRMRSTTRGSVIKETMRMRPPHGYNRGSASKIFLINRAHVLRASLEQSEMSCPPGFALGEAAFLSSAVATEIRPRLE